MTPSPPGWIDRSAINGSPITTVAARSGSLMSRAWSRSTGIASFGWAEAAHATRHKAAARQTARPLAAPPRTHHWNIAVSDTLRGIRQLNRPARLHGFGLG